MTHRTALLLPPLVIALLVTAACGGGARDEHPKEHPDKAAAAAKPAPAPVPAPAPTPAPPGPAARAVVSAANASGVAGEVTFTQLAGGVQVSATITGLTPGLHGFHVHEWGDCSAPDATSAGGHFNPGGHDHAGPMAEMAHVGDLGNIEAGADGVARLSLVTGRLSVGQGDNDVLGRAVIVHADADDLMSQPTGNAGARVGCGVIQAEGGATAPVRAPAN